MSPDSPIFIVGPPRSGTTLLCTLINQHPDIALMHEPGLLMFGQSALRHMIRHDWVERLEFCSRLLQRHQVEPSALENAPDETPRDALVSLYREYAKTCGATRFGEKTPSYIVILPKLLQAFPDAKVIVLWRDVDEICRSILRRAQSNRHFRDRGMLVALARGYEDLQRWLGEDSVPSKSIFHASYERTLQDTERLMREIAEFLDVSYDPAMTDIATSDQSFIVGSGSPLGDRLARFSYDDEGLVPEHVAAKLNRYVRRWNRLYPNLYPVYIGSQREIPDGAECGWAEQQIDRLKHALVQQRNLLRNGILARIPLSWWMAYRRWRPIERKSDV